MVDAGLGPRLWQQQHPPSLGELLSSLLVGPVPGCRQARQREGLGAAAFCPGPFHANTGADDRQGPAGHLPPPVSAVKEGCFRRVVRVQGRGQASEQDKAVPPTGLARRLLCRLRLAHRSLTTSRGRRGLCRRVGRRLVVQGLPRAPRRRRHCPGRREGQEEAQPVRLEAVTLRGSQSTANLHDPASCPTRREMRDTSGIIVCDVCFQPRGSGGISAVDGQSSIEFAIEVCLVRHPTRPPPSRSLTMARSSSSSASRVTKSTGAARTAVAVAEGASGESDSPPDPRSRWLTRLASAEQHRQVAVQRALPARTQDVPAFPCVFHAQPTQPEAC
jgi:hypothetical protein